MKVSEDILSQYKPHETSFLINDLDKDRRTIRISLPEPPPIELIDGYGELPENQVFKRKETPHKLKLLENEILKELQDRKKGNYQETITGYKLIEMFWERLEERAGDFEDEIEFIKHLWWYRTYGYWFFNDGKPTYITGRHFMFLTFFYMPDVKDNNGYPEYRDRHRREFLFRDYLRKAHHTFAKRDEKGWAVSNDDETYEMADMRMRLFYGVAHPKSRRNGSTIMSLSNMVEGAETGFGKYSTIVSKDGSSTEEAYKLKLLPAWNDRPLYIRPIWDGSFRPETIKYIPPKNSLGTESLMSIVDYTESAGTFKKDGNKLNGDITVDEPGKTVGVSILERHDVYKNAAALGDGTLILGFFDYISTVEEINAAGTAFLDLLDLSDFYQRGSNGQTSSGLAVMMFPSYDGQEGFIDRFGMSVIHEPTERQKQLRPDAQFALLNQGAFQYQQEKRDDFLKKGTPAAMQSYRAYVKKYPWCSSELSIGTSGDIGFDYEILDKRIAELRKQKSLNRMDMKVGNFYRYKTPEGKDDPDGNVYWRTEDNGRFELSYEPPQSLTNMKTRTMMYDVTLGKTVPQWRPVYMTKFTLGADPVEYSTQRKDTGSSKQSDPAMTVFREYDSTVEHSQNPSEWETCNVACFYRYRPASINDYCEDVLMAAEYFGAMIFPERNKTRLIEHIIGRGRGGYLKYNISPVTGRQETEPGYWASSETKQDGMGYTKDWIMDHAHRCNHLRLLEEMRNIRLIEELTRYDGLASFLACMMGSKSTYGKIQDRQSSSKIDLSRVNWLR